jgi:hypothetical protein
MNMAETENWNDAMKEVDRLTRALRQARRQLRRIRSQSVSVKELEPTIRLLKFLTPEQPTDREDMMLVNEANRLEALRRKNSCPLV